MASPNLAPVAAQTYSAAEQAEVQKWVAAAAGFKSAATGIAELNAHLATRTTVLGIKASAADVAVYEALAAAAKAWTPEQRTGKEGFPHVLRLLDFVQNRPELFGLEVADGDKISVDLDDIRYVAPPVDAKAEKERLKKEKAAAAAAAAGGAAATTVAKEAKLPDRTKEAAAVAATATSEAAAASPATENKKKEKKEKKEKPPKQQQQQQQQKKGAAPAAPAAAPLSPSLIDLRVGHILKAIKHPEADSLYVSTIAMGDAAGTADTEEYEGQVVRTVCSGLNGLVPLEEMQGRRVVVVCNLKPVKMRGIRSAAMVLAASPRLAPGQEDHHGGPVELVSPPPDSAAGERVFFQGWQDGVPEKQLNPKKKIWETFQPGFTTTDDLEVAFDAAVVKDLGKDGIGKLVTQSGGVCTVKSLKGATVR